MNGCILWDSFRKHRRRKGIGGADGTTPHAMLEAFILNTKWKVNRQEESGDI